MAGKGPTFDQLKARQLQFAVGLTALVLLGELAGGIWTRSLALLSDAGHVFCDVFSLALSLFALRLACRPPTPRHTYGLHRAEVFAALVNGLSLLAICFFIFREARERLVDPPEVLSTGLLAVALVGLVANWVVLTRLGGHAHGDINLRSAYLHVLGDLMASVGVVIGAVIIAFTGWQIVDPIISIGIGLLILVSAFRVTFEALHILLEGVPRGVEPEEVSRALADVPQVEGVHHVHAWSLCSNVTAFSAHIVVCVDTESERREVREQVEKVLAGRFGFAHTTIEMECEPSHEQSLLRHFEHGLEAEHSHDHAHGHGDREHDCNEREHDHDGACHQ